MTKIGLTDLEHNIYLYFCRFLNRGEGYVRSDDGLYYDIIDKFKISHERMLKICATGKTIFPPSTPYIIYKPDNKRNGAGGTFYFTYTGDRCISNIPDNNIPPYVEIKKEPKPSEIIKKKLENSENNVKKEEKQQEKQWSKQEVFNLLTNEAHVVARMLGTGYDLFEPIHGRWIKRWLTNPENRRVMIHQAHRSSFKCFNPETLVMMSDCTSKRIKDIQVGDYVMGWDGTPRKVLSKHSGIDDMYRVTLTKNGESFECNGEHILTMKQTVFKHDKFHCVDKYRDKENPLMIDIPVKDFIKSSAYKRRKKNNETFFKHFKVGLDTLKEQSVDIPPYVLGCWLGDGSSHAVSVTTMDEEIRQEFKQWCESLGLTERVHIKRNRANKAKTYAYAIKHFCKKGENKAVNIFKKYNLLNNKHIPLEYLNNSKEIRYELLAGLIDTDGTYGSSGHYTYVTVSENLAKQVEWLARSLGYNATAKQIGAWCFYNGVKKESKAWQVYINGSNLCDIPVRLRRKKAKEKNTSASRYTSFSQLIEPIGKGEFVGIEIGGDGRYLLDSFTVVHNSSCLRLFIAIFLTLKPLDTVILIRKSEDAVKELVNGVSKILDTPLFNTFINILHPEIVTKGGFKKTVDTALAIDTNLNISLSGEYQLRAVGLGSPLTGKHAKLIITDDIVTTDDRESEAKRRETIAKYQELMNLISSNKAFADARILNIGTPWHEEDAFSLMEKGLPPKEELQLKLEAIPKKKRTEKQNEAIRMLNARRGKYVYNCYQTGLMSEKDVEWMKQSLNDDVLFAANYLLDLVSDEECPFPRIDNMSDRTKMYFKDAYEVFAAIDCSYGGEDGTSLSIGACDWETNETIVFGQMWHKIAIDENYLEVAEIMYDCGVQTIFLESNADKGLMGQKFRELGFNVVSYHEHTNKHTKIVSTIRPYWREKSEELLPCVKFTSDTDPDYLSEIYNYKKGVKHDDAPDNLACLLLYSHFGSMPIRIT